MNNPNQIEKDELIIALAGDSGDGIQLIGLQLTYSIAQQGRNVNALPDYPAEIRAPAGTVAGVSSFQLKISVTEQYTPGDKVDILFAMNPAALKANLGRLASDALLLINSDLFNDANYKKADFLDSLFDSQEFSGYTIHKIPVTTLTKEAAKAVDISHSELVKCKNMFVLGVIAWVTDTNPELIIKQIQDKFFKHDSIVAANESIFKAGFNYADTAELFYSRYFPNSHNTKTKINNLGSGNKAFADACLAVYLKSKGKVFVSGYPITPASSLLQNITKYQAEYGLNLFQAEDEISSVCSAIGAAYGGFLSLTITSGPGFDLKTEGLGLAVITELPLVVINVQRAGPSTGMPTKTEQSDLFAAVFGRHGDSPIPVLAPSTPADCYEVLIEAFGIATKYMTPVIILSDAYLANAVENLPIKRIADLPDLTPRHPLSSDNYQPYARDDESLARSWAIPGMAGFEHCLGGLEKAENTGRVCYEAENHQRMVSVRQRKIENIASHVANEYFLGRATGELLLIGWGSSYGAIKETCIKLQKSGYSVSMLHIKHIFPLPIGLADLLKQFRKVVVIEQNTGHLAMLIRAKTLSVVEQYNVYDGQPISTVQLEQYLMDLLKNNGEKNVCNA